jgi:hypothetical protein
MDQKEVSERTNKELPAEGPTIKPSPVVDAFFIGFLVGIVIYSLVVSSWGFFTLIPLFLIYRLLKKSKRN